MKNQSINLVEFQKRFSNESDCLDHLFRMRWPAGFVCPRCGNRIYSLIRTRRLYQCSACRHQTSVTAGTIFHKTRTPLQKWFWMIFMMTRQKCGVSILRMQRLLGIGSYRTAWLIGHKIRKGMQDRDSRDKLAGLVEIGDAFLKPKRERGKARFLVGVERKGRKPGSCTMRLVDHVDEKSVVSLASEKILLGTRIRTYDRAAYRSIMGRSEDQTNDGSAKGKRRQRRLRWMHTLASNFLGNIRGVHHGVSKKHLQRYLAEFCYRFNRRLSDSSLFNLAISDCLSVPTITWDEVTAYLNTERQASA